jgi:Flp pilus assembly protein TadB
LRHIDSVRAEDPVTSTTLKNVAARLMAVSDRVASSPARRDKLHTRLNRADVSLTPGEWVAVQGLVSFSSGALGTLLFGSLIAGLLLAVGGFAASAAWLSSKGRRRLRAFDERLPSALQLVASSLRSGFSLAQALDGVVREGVEPIAGEVNRALSEARLGMALEDALDGISERMASTDWSWVVMAIRVQREVGGNLAEILLNTAGVMRERARLRRQVKALSAEGRLSAYVLIALPLLMAMYMFAVRRSYIRPLYTTGPGIAMLVFAIFLVLMGALWMRKVVTVEV